MALQMKRVMNSLYNKAYDFGRIYANRRDPDSIVNFFVFASLPSGGDTISRCQEIMDGFYCAAGRSYLNKPPAKTSWIRLPSEGPMDVTNVNVRRTACDDTRAATGSELTEIAVVFRGRKAEMVYTGEVGYRVNFMFNRSTNRLVGIHSVDIDETGEDVPPVPQQAPCATPKPTACDDRREEEVMKEKRSMEKIEEIGRLYARYRGDDSGRKQALLRVMQGSIESVLSAGGGSTTATTPTTTTAAHNG